MTISKKDRMLLYCLAGIVIFIAMYFLGYTRYVDKTDAVLAEIDGLEPRLAQLKEYESNEKQYEASIQQAKNTIEELSPRLPRSVRPEDLIMLAIGLEDEVGISISTVGFDVPAPMMDFNTVRELEKSYEVVPVSAWQAGMTASCVMTYPQLKDMVRYIYSRPLMTTLSSVSVSYDSMTGELFGSVKLDKYYITGFDDAYMETQIPPLEYGVGNIFGSITGEEEQE